MGHNIQTDVFMRIGNDSDDVLDLLGRKLQKEIAKTNGLSVAADLIEESLVITKKVGALQV